MTERYGAESRLWLCCRSAAPLACLLLAVATAELHGREPATVPAVPGDHRSVHGEASRSASVRKSPAATLRVAAYNVLFGNWSAPERVGTKLSHLKLDVIAMSEVPAGDWTHRVGHACDMKHAYVGNISSANHADKFKSLLSKTPLGNCREFAIDAQGWSPASAVVADTIVDGIPITLISTHLPGRPYFSDTAEGSAAELLCESVIPALRGQHLFLLGDLNNLVGDQPLLRLEKIGLRSIWQGLQMDVGRLSTHQHIESGSESGVIDHIYWRAPGVKVVEGGILYNAFNPFDEVKQMKRYRSEWQQSGKPLSDHRPIWSTFSFSAESTSVATVVAMGDSITKGVCPGVAFEDTFTAGLDRRLRRAGHAASVLNLGIDGETTEQGLQRLEEIIAMQPREIIVMYGTADSMVAPGKTESRVALGDFRTNLAEIVTRFKSAQIEPLLMTPPQLAESTAQHPQGQHRDHSLADYVRACRDVAREHGVALVDHFAEWNRAAHQGQRLSEWTTDGSHPNPAGHAQIARTILPRLLERLESKVAVDR